MAKPKDWRDPFSNVWRALVIGGVVLIAITIVAACVAGWDLRDDPRVWRYQSAIVVVGVLCTVIGLVVLGCALAVQSRRDDRQAEELARAAKALYESESRFGDIIQLSGDWIWETGPRPSLHVPRRQQP
jgi:hypothetical protein